MKLRRAVLVAVFVAGAAIACSLNPQPLPPGQPDGSTTGLDAGKGNDGTGFGDSGGFSPDGESDSAPLPQSDGGENDAAEDAGDAADAADAGEDAADDGALDAPSQD